MADANAVAGFSLVAARSNDPRAGRATFGAAEAVAVGVEMAFFNPVLALDPVTTPEDILAALAWVEGRGLPASVQLAGDADPRVRTAIEDAGLAAAAWAMPVMVMQHIPPTQAAPVGVTIRGGGAELSDDWHAGIGSGESMRRLFHAAFMDDPRTRFVVGYLDGAPVSGAIAIGSGPTVGVYSVGTLQQARRRGIGRAVTAAAIDAGVGAWGASMAVLQSSEMGLPLYRSMGFVEIARYVQFRRPTD